MLTLVRRHRVGCLGLVVVHARVGALGFLKVREHVVHPCSASARHHCGVIRIECHRRRGDRYAVLLELGRPVGCVLILDVCEFEQSLAAIAIAGLGERAGEHRRLALGVEVLQEALRITGTHPDPSVLPASAAAGSINR